MNLTRPNNTNLIQSIMKLIQLLPFRVSKSHILLIGIALGIASQRIPEVKIFTDYILHYVEDSFPTQSIALVFQKYKMPFKLPI